MHRPGVSREANENVWVRACRVTPKREPEELHAQRHGVTCHKMELHYMLVTAYTRK